MRLIKRLLPRTLFGRWLLLLMAPIVILQGLLTYIFYERHWDTVTRRLALGLSGEIATIIDMRDRSSSPVVLGDLLLGMQSTLQLSVTFTPNTKFPVDLPPPRVYSILDRMLVQALGERLTQPYLIDTQRDDGNIAIYVQ
ncbi:hypothetical protein, partial [Vreelandella neptunia]